MKLLNVYDQITPALAYASQLSYIDSCHRMPHKFTMMLFCVWFKFYELDFKN